MQKHAQSVRHTQGPSEEEWEAIRPTFEMLYLVQNLSLREVMQLLRDCFAVKITTKTCKMHIKRWGFDKKNKEQDMRTVFRLAKKRKAAGKESTFTIRGRPFKLVNAVHNFRRRTKTLDSGLELENDEVDSTDVGCMTPMRLPDEIPPLFQAPQDLPEWSHLERILVKIPRAVEACAVFAGSSGPIQPARRYLGVGMGVRYWFTQRRIRSENPEPLDWQVLDRFYELAHTELKACKIGVIAGCVQYRAA